jgi:3-mercaptopyruvate sulfurtransferase SseA
MSCSTPYPRFGPSTASWFALAAQLLRKAGFDEIYVVRGGVEEWRRRGFPVDGVMPDENS